MDTPDLAREENQELAQFVEGLNEQLRAAGAERAEQAFGLGCGVGLLPAITLVVVLYMLPVVNIVLAIMFLLLIMLILVGVVMLLSYRARRNAIKRAYEDNVEGEIEAYTKANHLSRLQFDSLAQEHVSEGAPLRGFLSAHQSTTYR